MSRMHCAPRVPGRAGEWQSMMTSDCVLQYVALNTSAIGINRSVCMLWFLERQVMPCAHSSGVLWDSILGFIFSHQKLPYFTSRVTPRFEWDQLCAPPAAIHRECGDIPLVCRLDTAPCPCGMLWVLLESGNHVSDSLLMFAGCMERGAGKEMGAESDTSSERWCEGQSCTKWVLGRVLCSQLQSGAALNCCWLLLESQIQFISLYTILLNFSF